METIGAIIDRICTANNKMFMEQEKIYAIKRMSFDEFKDKYEKNMKDLYDYFQKCAILNLQRNAAIDEIDVRLVNLVKDCVAGKELDDGSNIQLKCKTEDL
jgi:hypothetical protein